MGQETASETDQLATGVGHDYSELEGRVPQEIYVFKLGVQDIIARDTADGPGVELYKRAGTTREPGEMADHDGPLLFKGQFYRMEETDEGWYQMYHPFAGRGPSMGRGKTVKPVTLLSEVERLV